MNLKMNLFALLALLTIGGCEQSNRSTENPDAFCKQMLAEGEPKEVRDWLAQGPRNTLGVIQSNAESIVFAEAIYRAGAPHVYAVEIQGYADGMENTGALVIQMPVAPDARAAVLDWSEPIANARGFEAYSDVGQEYIFVMLD